MSTVRIPAKKTLEPGMDINDMDCFWDYIDMYVEEDSKVSGTNKWAAVMSEEYEDGSDDWDDCYDDSWEDYDGSCMSDKDWDYYDAFEGDPEAVWGREW